MKPVPDLIHFFKLMFSILKFYASHSSITYQSTRKINTTKILHFHYIPWHRYSWILLNTKFHYCVPIQFVVIFVTLLKIWFFYMFWKLGAQQIIMSPKELKNWCLHACFMSKSHLQKYSKFSKFKLLCHKKKFNKYINHGSLKIFLPQKLSTLTSYRWFLPHLKTLHNINLQPISH